MPNSYDDISRPEPGGLDLKIFIKDVHDAHGRKRSLTVRPWSTVKDVKDLLSNHLHVPPSSQFLYFGGGSGGGGILRRRELPNRWTLVDAGVYRSGETLLLEIKGAAQSACASISSLGPRANDVCVSSVVLDLAPKALRRLVQQARRGLALGLKPALAPDGSGGSYFLSDARRARVGVFKPADEEPFAVNNPRGYVPDYSAGMNVNSDDPAGGLRKGIKPGDSCLREVAAFLLDRNGFHGVPMTTLAECRHPALHVNGARWNPSVGGASLGLHPLQLLRGNSAGSDRDEREEGADGCGGTVKKVGSFQEFAHAECCMDDLSPSKITADEVHKIAILDIRIMNADRNVANILCQRIPEDPDHFRLVPIDHGYSLRSTCDVAWFDWCWLDWPQLKEPLSNASLEFVKNIDVEADARLLRERLDFSDDVLDGFRASCKVLKAGVAAGLTLYDIASEILCRNDAGGEIPSRIETLTSMASELAVSAVYNGRFHHAAASLALTEQLSTPSNRRYSMSASKHRASTSFTKSASHNILVSTMSGLEDGGVSVFTDELYPSTLDLNSDWANNKVPPMAQSSTSDCGSSSAGESSRPASPATSMMADCGGAGADADGEDVVEAEEWAAALIAVADESLEKDSSAQPSGANRGRSVSDCSSNTDSSDQRSAGGFWHVRPGSPSLEDDGEGEEEVSASDDDDWTPSPSSSSDPPAMFSDSLVCGVSRLSNVLHPGGFSANNLSKLLQSSNRLSSLSGLSGSGSNGGEEDITDEFPSSPSVQLVGSLPFPKHASNTLMRSISFSAFSSKTDYAVQGTKKSSRPTAVMRGNQSSAMESNHFRTYFMKFVDLLVARETERLRHRSRMSQTSNN